MAIWNQVIGTALMYPKYLPAPRCGDERKASDAMRSAYERNEQYLQDTEICYLPHTPVELVLKPTVSRVVRWKVSEAWSPYDQAKMRFIYSNKQFSANVRDSQPGLIGI